MLKGILAITGKPGLYKLVSQGNNMLIVESFEDGKRTPTYARDKVVSLNDVAMFTTEDDMPLGEVLEKLKAKENGSICSFDAKKADNDQLRNFFAEVLPNYDRDRVYPSDIRKLISWYNILIKAGITDFRLKEEDATDEAPVQAELPTPKAEKKAAPKAQVKTSKAAAPKTRTNVGTKKG